MCKNVGFMGAGWFGTRETPFSGLYLPSPPHLILLRVRGCSLKGGPVRMQPQTSFTKPSVASHRASFSRCEKCFPAVGVNSSCVAACVENTDPPLSEPFFPECREGVDALHSLLHPPVLTR